MSSCAMSTAAEKRVTTQQMVPEAKSYIPNFLMCVACTKPPYMFNCIYNYQICAETSRHLETN